MRINRNDHIYDKGQSAETDVTVRVPLLLGNLLQQTYNIIDAAIVGQILGAKALASVGAAAVFSFWYWDSAWEAVQALVFL